MPENLLPFLLELRKRLLRCLIVVSIIFLALIYFANDIYTLLALPLLKFLPEGHGLIATNLVSPFFAPMKLTLIFSLFLAIPFCLYQLWAFIAPALYQREKRLVWPLLFSSTCLFYVGIAFAYFIIFPVVFHFLTQTAPQHVTVMPDINEYLDFTLKLFFAFGFAFELPVAIILLIWSGITSAEKLRKNRPYVIVLAFIIGMLLTPPDVISQTLLAVPLWLLFELGIFLSQFLVLTRKS